MIKAKVHMLRGKGSAAQKRDLLERRIRLAKQIISFEKAMAELVPGEWQAYHLSSNPSESDFEDSDELEPDDDTDSDCSEEDGDIGEVPLEWENSERTIIRMPSRLNLDMLKTSGMEELIDQEATLRGGLMNEVLRFLRTHLGEKAFILRCWIRGKLSNRVKGAGYREVAVQNKSITKQVRIFKLCRSALIRLGRDAPWPDITEDDLRLSGDITEPNRLGQNKDVLPWFWRLEEGGESEANSSERMEECKSFFPIYSWLNLMLSLSGELAESKGPGYQMGGRSLFGEQ
jgi:hypothetical protein